MRTQQAERELAKPKEVKRGPFSKDTLDYLRLKLNQINKDPRLTNVQIMTLYLAMKNRRKDHSKDFDAHGPVAGAFLKAIWQQIDRKYPKLFPGFPPGVSISWINISSDAPQRALKILSRKSITFSGNDITLRNRNGDVFVMEILGKLNMKEKRNLARELGRWLKSPEPYPLAEAFRRSGLPDLLLGGVARISPDLESKRMDPSAVLGRSAIAQKGARDFLYSPNSGLTDRSLLVLETALNKRAKNPNYEGSKLFRSVKNQDQRDLILLAYLEMTAGKNPLRGRTARWTADEDSIRKAFRDEGMMREFREAKRLSDYHMAAINHPSFGTTIYLRIPKRKGKRGLMDDETFKNVTKSKMSPQELIRSFGFEAVAGEIFQTYTAGTFKPLTETQRRKLYAAFRKESAKVRVAAIKARPKAAGRKAA